jgi:hypothetical protein
MTDSLKITLANARIDSLQNVLIKNQIDIAEKTNRLEALMAKHVISEGYFSEILNSQLFLFSVVLAAIGFISWSAIKKTLSDEIDKVENKLKYTIENVDYNHKEQKRITTQAFKEFKSDFKQLSAKTTTALQFTLTQAASQLLNSNKFSYIYLETLLIASISEDQGEITGKEAQFLIHLNNIKEFLKRPNITQINKEQMLIIKQSLTLLKTCENPQIIKDLGFVLVKLDELEQQQ